MFEKMSKYKKGWSVFCKWFYKKHEGVFDVYQSGTFVWINDVDYEFDDELVLLSMLSFFTEKRKKGIIINVYPSISFRKPWTFNIYNSKFEKIFLVKPDEILLYQFETHLEAFKQACEKAFEIFEAQLNQEAK